MLKFLCWHNRAFVLCVCWPIENRNNHKYVTIQLNVSTRCVNDNLSPRKCTQFLEKPPFVRKLDFPAKCMDTFFLSSCHSFIPTYSTVTVLNWRMRRIATKIADYSNLDQVAQKSRLSDCNSSKKSEQYNMTRRGIRMYIIVTWICLSQLWHGCRELGGGNNNDNIKNPEDKQARKSQMRVLHFYSNWTTNIRFKELFRWCLKGLILKCLLC